MHAQPRATKDLDIFVKADAENAQALFVALRKFGAPLAGLTSSDFADRGRAIRSKRGSPRYEPFVFSFTSFLTIPCSSSRVASPDHSPNALTSGESVGSLFGPMKYS